MNQPNLRVDVLFTNGRKSILDTKADFKIKLLGEFVDLEWDSQEIESIRIFEAANE